MTRMHADEVVTDVGLVRALLREQHPRWADLPVAPVPSTGTDNAVYRLGDDLAVRLPRRPGWAVDALELERRWLPRLASAVEVAVPVPVAHGEPGAGYPWPWAVYRWVPGANPTTGDADEVLAEDVARFVRSLRALGTAGAPRAGRGVPLVRRDEPTRAALAQLAGEVDVEAATGVWEEALAAAPWAGEPVWVHGDLSPGNLVVDGGRLTGVIDFNGLGVGDPACDLIVAWNLLPERARRVYRAALDVDDDTWARGRGWALSVALIQLPYYRDTNPGLVANSRHTIAQVLADGHGG